MRVTRLTAFASLFQTILRLLSVVMFARSVLRKSPEAEAPRRDRQGLCLGLEVNLNRDEVGEDEEGIPAGLAIQRVSLGVGFDGRPNGVDGEGDGEEAGGVGHVVWWVHLRD